jgi:hypothetical protein
MKKTGWSASAVEKMVEEQVRKWDIMRREKKKVSRPVITLSRQTGSEGRQIATTLAKELGLDIYGRRIIDEVAKSAKMSAQLVATLDEKGRTMLDDWISILEKDRNLWSYEYLRHLAKIVNIAGKHGNAILLGRGANFILPPEDVLRIRIVAPLNVRIKNVMKEFGCSKEDARHRVMTIDSERKAFVLKYFNADIEETTNYDLVINTKSITTDQAVQMIKLALK